MSSGEWDWVILGAAIVIILLSLRYARTHPKVPHE
jgi:hypothetical protein